MNMFQRTTVTSHTLACLLVACTLVSADTNTTLANATLVGADGSNDDAAENPKDKIYRKWVAHGLLMAIAWAILVPLAIGSSMLRTLLPNGVWFILHRLFNSIALACTIVGFIFAVQNVNLDDGLHFHTNNHRSVGLAVFMAAVLQAASGILRPHLPKPQRSDNEDTSGDSEVEDGATPKPKQFDEDDSEANRKSTARVVWEYGHRIFGLGLLGLAWYNCYTGIDEFVADYPFQKNVQPALWGVVGGLGGTILVLYVVAKAKV